MLGPTASSLLIYSVYALGWLFVMCDLEPRGSESVMAIKGQAGLPSAWAGLHAGSCNHNLNESEWPGQARYLWETQQPQAG